MDRRIVATDPDFEAEPYGIHEFNGDRQSLIPLFSLADDAPLQIAAYMAMGRVLVARTGARIIGQAQIIESDKIGEFELKSLAVLGDCQGRGVGRDLVSAALEFCRGRMAHRLIVSTACCDIDNLRFYQRQGFRMRHIVRDAFVPANGYMAGTFVDGIELRDQVVLDFDLG